MIINSVRLRELQEENGMADQLDRSVVTVPMNALLLLLPNIISRVGVGGQFDILPAKPCSRMGSPC